jgi:hypothetical protein
MAPAAIGLMAVGTGMGIMGSIQEGKTAQKIANARAAVDMMNAEQARVRSAEEATIFAEKGQRLLATQQSRAAASGIRIDVGSPLVVKAETQAAITRDKGFILQGGEAEYTSLMNSAKLEKAMGKAARKKSIWDAATTGVKGFGSMAYMGYQSGMFSGGNGMTLETMQGYESDFMSGRP